MKFLQQTTFLFFKHRDVSFRFRISHSKQFLSSRSNTWATSKESDVKKIQTNKNKKWFKYLPSIVQVVVLILSTNNTAVNHKHIISNTFKYEGVEDFFCLRMLIVFKTSWLIYTCSFSQIYPKMCRCCMNRNFYIRNFYSSIAFP